MKTRSGFVSNSSSSSFIVATEDLTMEQRQWIKNHIKAAKMPKFRRDEPFDNSECGDGEAWEIREVGQTLVGATSMDNFDMRQFMQRIGVDTSKVIWGDGLHFPRKEVKHESKKRVRK
jgi:hypothetical protein